MPIEVLEMYLEHISENNAVQEITMCMVLGLIYVKIGSIYGTKRFIGASVDTVIRKIRASL